MTIKNNSMSTIHDIAVFVAIFASGMLAGYMLKIVKDNYERIKEKV